MKISQILFIMNSWKVLFYSIEIHANVFLYIYDKEIWIFKHAIILIIHYQKPFILSQDMHKVILVYFFILCM